MAPSNSKPSDSKPSDFERRASTRISRTLSIQANGNGVGTADADVDTEDHDFNIMALTVADGFRPSEHSRGVSSFPPTTSSSDSSATSDSRPSFSSIDSPPGQLRSSMAAETASISSDSDSASSSAPASIPAPPISDPSDTTDPLDSSAASSSTAHYSQPTASLEAESYDEADAQAAHAAMMGMSAHAAMMGTSVRPSSIAKPPLGSNSLSSSSGGGPSSTSNAVAGASSSVPVPGEEPYQGPSGPSFPYQLYPQNVRMSRTVSGITTASAAAPSESSYSGPRGPTFPYSLYPQSTMAGSGTVPTSAIPVGFPGMADTYQRRLGPDGEDIADMIGPDGHTEQLPPYSRYPDNYSGKLAAVMAAVPATSDNVAGAVGAAGAADAAGAAVAANAVAGSGTAGTPAAADAVSASNLAPGTVPIAVPDSVPAAGSDQAVAALAAESVPALHPIPGAGGIGLAPRNPEFDSSDDLDSPQSRHSSRSFTSDASQHEINAGGHEYNEKRLSPRLRHLARRRLFGIVPYWAICLAITALIIMCIILGAVIGTFLSRHHKPPQQHASSASTAAVTVTVDATPIPTPSNLIALPTGTYSLPLTLNKSPNSCFNDTTQSATWNCNVWYMAGMTVDISSEILGSGNISYGMSIGCNISETLTSDIFWYGEQPPVVPTATSLQLVNDTADLTRGPAWFTMLPYNKTVIVPESLLTAPTAVVTGDVQGASVSTRMRRRKSLEQLIGRDGGGGPQNHQFGVAQAGDKPWVCVWPDTVLEVFIYPNQNTSWSNIQSSGSSGSSGSASGSASGAYSTLPASTSTPTSSRVTSFTGSKTTGTAQTVGVVATATTPSPASTMPAPFPRVVKLEERRMAGSPEATCVQYQLKPAGTGVTAVPNLNGNGQRIEVTIAEVEQANDFSRRDLGEESLFGRRDSSDLSDCGCLWIVS